MSKLTDKYYLSIHHRSIAININPDDGSIEKSTSPGHFYVSLQKNEDKKFFGKYGQGKSLIQHLLSKEVIESEREGLYTSGIKALEAQTGEEYHSFKSIIGNSQLGK